MSESSNPSRFFQTLQVYKLTKPISVSRMCLMSGSLSFFSSVFLPSSGAAAARCQSSVCRGSVLVCVCWGGVLTRRWSCCGVTSDLWEALSLSQTGLPPAGSWRPVLAARQRSRSKRGPSVRQNPAAAPTHRPAAGGGGGGVSLISVSISQTEPEIIFFTYRRSAGGTTFTDTWVKVAAQLWRSTELQVYFLFQ